MFSETDIEANDIGDWGLIFPHTLALNALRKAQEAVQKPAIKFLPARAQAVAASSVQPMNLPSVKPPGMSTGVKVALVGGLAAVVLGGAYVISKRRSRSKTVAQAMGDLMDMARCTRKSGGECECWEFPGGQRVCVR